MEGRIIHASELAGHARGASEPVEQADLTLMKRRGGPWDNAPYTMVGSRRLTRRNRKFLRKFEQYKPNGMNNVVNQGLETDEV